MGAYLQAVWKKWPNSLCAMGAELANWSAVIPWNSLSGATLRLL